MFHVSDALISLMFQIKFNCTCSREASGSVLADLLLEAADASDFRFFPPIRDIPHAIAQAIEGSLPHRTK